MIHSNKYNTNDIGDIGDIGVFNRKLYDGYSDYDEYDNKPAMAFLEVFIVVILYILLLCVIVMIQTCCCVFFKSMCVCFSTRVHPNKFVHCKENIGRRQNKTIKKIKKFICKKGKGKGKRKRKRKTIKRSNKIDKYKEKSICNTCLQKKENEKCVDTPIDSENINIVIQ